MWAMLQIHSGSSLPCCPSLRREINIVLTLVMGLLRAAFTCLKNLILPFRFPRNGEECLPLDWTSCRAVESYILGILQP
jgi:hypothetical protein